MRKNSRKQKQALTGWIMTSIALVGVGALFAAPMLITPPPKLDLVTLCPIDRPISVDVALLVDRTDPYDAAQQLRVGKAINEAKGSLPVGGRLTVHLLTADATEAARPVLELCNPGDGSLVDPLLGNPRKVQRKFEDNFAAPIEALAASLMGGESANSSPILEAIGFVSGRFERNIPNRLIVISDLLQNSATQSHYRHAPNSMAALNSAVGLLLKDGRLAQVEVELVLLQNPAHLDKQGTALVEFWREVLLAAGARPSFQSF